MKATRILFGRWAAIALLAASAIPIFWAMQPGRDVRMPVSPDETWEVPGEIVVDVRDSASAGEIAALAGRFGVAFTGQDAAVNPGKVLTVKTLPSAAAGLLARLRSDPLVEAAEPQRIWRAFWEPNDPRFKEQWNFQRIRMPEAWETTKGKGVVVAVIDTGVAFEKDDKCYHARDFKGTKFTKPYDFVNRDRHPNDDHGHGTHVAGTIAESTDNGEGVAGIAPEATIMPLKVLSASGSGSTTNIAQAIRYAADNGAHVINMSLGGPFPDTVMRNACAYAAKKGVVIVCAAGNSGREGVGYPAAYPECIAVSALGPEGKLAFYSSWGKQVAISAPGGDKSYGDDKGILQNTVIPGQSGGADGANRDLLWTPYQRAMFDAEDRLTGDDYYYFQGTSMASPHVAGVAALVISQGVKDPAEVKAVLQKSARKAGPKEKYGAGELDAAAAVKLARSTAQVYWERLGLVVGIWLAGIGLGLIRRKGSGPYPVAAALALTIGVFLPDVVAYLAGHDSLWNMAGHSVLIPGYLLVFEADKLKERRWLALVALAVTAHLCWDLLRGTAPAIGPVAEAALPWLWTNIAVGFGAFFSGLRR